MKHPLRTDDIHVVEILQSAQTILTFKQETAINVNAQEQNIKYGEPKF